ncbi:MAG: SDR family oxidoreductase [Myxococcales bacterium]|nr:MAG: SDR family oxidoreductase [Myxococcales bacterium]
MATVLITGANRGIGLELSRQLTERGDEVIALCRQSSPELQALGVRTIEGVDVTDDSTLRAASEELGDVEADVLINYAGIFTIETFRDLDFEEIRRNFEVNALGALRVTHALQGHLRRGGKIILITSRMGSIDDNGSGAYYGYRMAKAALNMAGVNLAHDFRGRASVAILHPGLVATRMTGFSGIPTEESAAGLIARIDELQPKDSGGFWHANGERLPW